MKISGKLSAALLSALLAAGSLMAVPASAASSYPVYRAYNPNTGEHVYTLYARELNNMVWNGWRNEGAAWTAPESGWYVYRLYNPNAGDHHYTMDEDEKDALVSFGWEYEGVAFASPYLGWTNPIPADASPVYRLYNPNAVQGSHHYTPDASEANALIRLGWRYEGVGWYGL